MKVSAGTIGPWLFQPFHHSTPGAVLCSKVVSWIETSAEAMGRMGDGDGGGGGGMANLGAQMAAGLGMGQMYAGAMGGAKIGGAKLTAASWATLTSIDGTLQHEIRVAETKLLQEKRDMFQALCVDRGQRMGDVGMALRPDSQRWLRGIGQHVAAKVAQSFVSGTGFFK